MTDRRACVVGSLNADHRVRVPRIPAAGETVMGSQITAAAGGKGANQAVAAARAGARTKIVGAIGDDRDGELVRQALAQQAIDMSHVRVMPDMPTGRALITVDADGENTIVVSPGANAGLRDTDVTAGLRDLERGDLVLLQLETPEPPVRHAARTAAEAGCVVILNAAPVPASVDGLFDHVDLLVVNEHELAGVANLLRGTTDRRPREEDMALLAGESDATVVCTAGGRGAFVTHGGGIEHIEAYPVDAVDTTAAGDTFIGYLAAGLITDTDNIIGAIETAARAAAIAVTRPGAIDSIPFADAALTTKEPS